MTLEEHARAIEAAIQAAADDGFELDDGSGGELYCVELNVVQNGQFVGDPLEICIPPVTY
ncbi:hypothetical protein ABZ128_09515 [Streptomyces sp. NPDC006326]|uniref:hypothetical protein n=1 Tax=Streptomyces sp. NPDC006326 TaxID=3156752 RepID=UPI0033AD4E6A